MGALGAFAAACSGPAPKAPAVDVRPSLERPASDVRSAPAPILAPTAKRDEPSRDSAPLPTFTVELTREIEAPATALALEAPPHAAALGAEAVWIHDAKGWRSEALPASARRPPAQLSIFYGRDNRVRVVGQRATAAGLASIYLRWKPNGFIDGGGEIGRFADPRGGLVAVLGTKDPEIVCRPGDACIVKRRTGWTFVPAPAGVERVVLGIGEAESAPAVGWALSGLRLFRLGETFQPAGDGGTWQHADDLFALPDRAFVVETDAGRVHTFDGVRWQVSMSPIAHPRAIWGTSTRTLWLVGDGIAFHDGSTWSVASGAPGPFAAVAGRSANDVWIAGASGVFRVAVRAR